MHAGAYLLCARAKTACIQEEPLSDGSGSMLDGCNCTKNLDGGGIWRGLLDGRSTHENNGAPEATHPPTSQGTGLRKRRSYCRAYFSARDPALVTILETWGGLSNG